MTLDGLEKEFIAAFGPKNTKRAKKAKINLIRFADDVMITGSSQELLEKEVIPKLEQFLKERNLAISQEKSEIVHIKDGFDFLGQNIRKQRIKVWTKPSKKSIKGFLGKVRRIIKDNKQAATDNLIRMLNPLIRGWANYHRHGVSSKIFSKADSQIFMMVWNWAQRRHPHKSKQWVAKHYLNHGHLFGFTENQKRIQLIKASYTKIVRHKRIQVDANPYDPKYESYFEERLAEKWLLNQKRKDMLTRLWRQQKGTCPICSQQITQESRWEIHHIVRKVDGGPDTLRNMILLHQTCHDQVHSQGLTVVKPGPAKGP